MTPYERMMSRAVPVGACLESRHSPDSHGYPQIRDGARKVLAHRLSWIHANGPTKLHVLHACDNPRCIEITHLFVGTQAENMADMRRKGRRKHKLVKLTEEQVRHIRANPQESTRVLGRRYGVDSKTVHAARVGETWAHLV